MDYVSLNQINKLYWLGRYTERVSTTLQYLMGALDDCIDGKEMDYGTFCAALGLENHYDNTMDFMNRYLFDADYPDSLRAAAEQMLGDGMVLRETISSSTLSYLQMAIYSLEKAMISEHPSIELQEVIDNLMAFRGSYEFFTREERVRNILRTGSNVEHISLFLRLHFREEMVLPEVDKLLGRLGRAGMRLVPQNLTTLQRYLGFEGELSDADKTQILIAAENLFELN